MFRYIKVQSDLLVNLHLFILTQWIYANTISDLLCALSESREPYIHSPCCSLKPAIDGHTIMYVTGIMNSEVT